MNILTIPYITGGLSHLIPLYVLHQRYLSSSNMVNNIFLVNSNSQKFLTMQGVQCTLIDYVLEENLIISNSFFKIKENLIEMEKKAYNMVKPSLIIEDNSFFTPMIAEKNRIPRISIQRTGIFRSIDKCYRNNSHKHSIEKDNSISNSVFLSNLHDSQIATSNNYNSHLLRLYAKSKVKIIPGISTIERLPDTIEDRESYFYSGPLVAKDKPSNSLYNRLSKFLDINKQKLTVFVTTGTVDKTSTEKIIEFFVKRNYAVITTCNYKVNELYKQEVFYNKLFPLHYICGISNLVVHQCGSGIYHYPLMNGVPSLTVGTQCYDREDVALRLQELGVSGHIPHPNDNPNYWSIFLELVNRFEKNTLIDFNMMNRLRLEINETVSKFDMNEVIEYALA